MAESGRLERLQVMLTAEELAALDDWRFTKRMPSRAAAIRELLRRGLTAEGVDFTEPSRRSSHHFRVVRNSASGATDGANGRRS